MPNFKYAAAIAVFLSLSNQGSAALTASGSGVLVSAHGDILTNDHVIRECSSVYVRSRHNQFPSRRQAEVAWTDKEKDLALIRVSNDSSYSYIFFREGHPSPGDTVVVMGYPLALHDSTATLTVGYLNALTGDKDNPDHIQISAQVQPGNSGGPVLDASGNLIGIVESRLKNEIAQNVNFAIKAEVAASFLRRYGIQYWTAQSDKNLMPAEVGKLGRPATVLVECYSSEPAPVTAAPPPPQYSPPSYPSPPVQRQITQLPDCASTGVKTELFKIGVKMNVAVYDIYPVGGEWRRYGDLPRRCLDERREETD
jgi:S1-C subfamily serine protease